MVPFFVRDIHVGCSSLQSAFFIDLTKGSSRIKKTVKKGDIVPFWRPPPPKRVKRGHLLSDYRQKCVNGTRDILMLKARKMTIFGQKNVLGKCLWGNKSLAQRSPDLRSPDLKSLAPKVPRTDWPVCLGIDLGSSYKGYTGYREILGGKDGIGGPNQANLKALAFILWCQNFWLKSPVLSDLRIR